MAQRNQELTSNDPVTVVDDPARIRNVALVGHSGAGKTTLADAVRAGGPHRNGGGRGEPGPATGALRRLTSLRYAPRYHRGIKINILDTPGHADFADERLAGLRAADAALFVVSAVRGMDQATADLWAECAEHGMPRAVAVTQLDHPRADLDEMIALCQRVFGDDVLPLYLPMLDDDGVTVGGLMDLLGQRVLDYTGGLPAVVRAPDPEHLPAIAEARDELIQTIIAESEDDTLLDRYLSGARIEVEVLVRDLERAVARGHFHPAVPVCATSGLGLDALLELLTGAFPSPLERELPLVTGIDGTPRPPLTCDPTGPLLAEVVGTTADGTALVRVRSGTLRPEMEVRVSGGEPTDRGGPACGADDRIGRLHLPLPDGPQEVPRCVAGDICLVTGFADSITGPTGAKNGHTISPRTDPLLSHPW
jgi:elongation factor G